MGGMIGQTLAARHPNRVASLCSIMSGPGGRKPSVMPRLSVIGTLLARPPREREAYAAHVAEDLHADRLARLRGRLRAAARALAVDVRPLLLPDRDGAAADGDHGLRATGPAELHRIQCPTLVIHGKADKLMPPSAGEAVARAIPGARIELIEGMGHDLPAELWPRITRSIADNAARRSPSRHASGARA